MYKRPSRGEKAAKGEPLRQGNRPAWRKGHQKEGSIAILLWTESTGREKEAEEGRRPQGKDPEKDLFRGGGKSRKAVSF